MTITPLYSALLAFVFIVLSVRTIKLRRQFRLSIGHGNQPQLERAIRAHANFAEYVPFALLLLAMLETLTKYPFVIHVLGLALLFGRVLHAYSVSQLQEVIRLRVIAMLTTFAVMATAAGGILISLLLKQLS